MIRKIFISLAFVPLLAQNCFAQLDMVYNDLVWSDEFDTNGPVSGANWFHQTQLPTPGGWFNGELQHYTDRQENAFVAADNLHIVAKKENYTDQGTTKQYTSARLNSKFAFKYGRVDVRARLPITAGTWPAIWMLGKNVNEDGGYFDATHGTTNWPACGEIDIMERGIFPSQPVNYVQGTIHTTAGHGGSGSHGGTLAASPQSQYHIYSMNWSPNQISFLLDGVVYYTYNPAVKNADNWPFDQEQYLLLNVAMGGIAGGIPGNFVQDTMLIDYVRVYQNVVPDLEEPTDFTAAVGAVTHSTVELLLDSNDNSGTVVYQISYADTSLSFTRPAGSSQSVMLTNLTPDTTYTFTITATDLSGNVFAQNPIALQATTDALSGCWGTDTQALQGSFTQGYNYLFETIGTDVKVTFELLDDRADVSAYLWRQNPFAETPMTLVAAKTFTRTLTAQTLGATITYAVKFAYAGGMSVTKYLNYVVGTDCSLAVADVDRDIAFSFLNPARDILHIRSGRVIDEILLYDMRGVLVGHVLRANDVDISMLTKGMYWLRVRSGEYSGVKKLIVH